METSLSIKVKFQPQVVNPTQAQTEQMAVEMGQREQSGIVLLTNFTSTTKASLLHRELFTRHP
jgi:hypothetical protein